MRSFKRFPSKYEENALSKSAPISNMVCKRKGTYIVFLWGIVYKGTYIVYIYMLVDRLKVVCHHNLKAICYLKLVCNQNLII